MNEQMLAIGKRITSLRLSRNMTREKLAECADISVQFLSDIEKGKKGMTVNTLCRICNALSVNADCLIYGNDVVDLTEEITSMVNTLSPEQKKNARDLLWVFVQSVK